MIRAQLLAYEPNDVKPGWLAFWIFIALCVALAILMRSFANQIKRVDFDEDDPGTGTGTGDERDRTAASDDETAL